MADGHAKCDPDLPGAIVRVLHSKADDHFWTADGGADQGLGRNVQ